MVACICHLIFFCHNTLFFKKYCVEASLSQHITFSVTTHYFFQRYCVVHHVRNTIFFEKIMCCGKFVTTHYVLSHNTLFFAKNIVLWQVHHNTLLFESQHIIFSKDIVLCAMSATIFFEKNNVLWQKKIRWQIHATIQKRTSGLYGARED